MRRFFLASLMLVSMQSAQAIMMTGDGIDTGHGFIAWSSLTSFQQQITALENQVSSLRKAFIISSVLVAGAFIYMQWSKKVEAAHVVDANPEEKKA